MMAWSSGLAGDLVGMGADRDEPADESRRLIDELTEGNAGLAPLSWVRQLLEIRGWPEVEEAE